MTNVNFRLFFPNKKNFPSDSFPSQVLTKRGTSEISKMLDGYVLIWVVAIG